MPAGTQSIAVAMFHYPQGKDGGGNPNSYWLLWNIPVATTSLSQGNTEGLGNMGSDKDGVTVGYTPPCSPPGSMHWYSIAVYALSEAPAALGTADDINVDWVAFQAGIAGTVLATSELTFSN